MTSVGRAIVIALGCGFAGSVFLLACSTGWDWLTARRHPDDAKPVPGAEPDPWNDRAGSDTFEPF